MNLSNAVKSLDNSIKVYESEKAIDENSLKLDVIAAGVIQNFEFTYELAWKTIRKWLAFNISPSAVDDITRRELYILAVDYGLISNEKSWLDFNAARNNTSHNYDEVVADDTLAAAQKFNIEAKKLLENLQK
jgi:nucleotidyltransferase substrate binding protein (TIGR01987 family)